MIRITSKRHNFRRCRVAHPKGRVEYPDKKFSREDLETLRAEPMLTVEIVESVPEKKTEKKAPAPKPKAKAKPKK